MSKAQRHASVWALFNVTASLDNGEERALNEQRYSSEVKSGGPRWNERLCAVPAAIRLGPGARRRKTYNLPTETPANKRR